MASSALGKKQYLLLGKLLVTRHPEVATDLLKEVSASEPHEKDFGKMSNYFNVFCRIMNIQPTEYRGSLRKTYKTNVRRLYVSVMLHLYSPGSFLHPANNIIITHGFIKSISEVLDTDESYMCLLSREVISMEKFYDDYKISVEKTRKKIISKKYNNAAA